MSGIEDLIESRRRLLVEGSALCEAKLAADEAARVAGEAWEVGWRGLLDAGFSERELKGAGLVAPGGRVVGKGKGGRRKVARSAVPVSEPVVESHEGGGRRALGPVEDFEPVTESVPVSA